MRLSHQVIIVPAVVTAAATLISPAHADNSRTALAPPAPITSAAAPAASAAASWSTTGCAGAHAQGTAWQSGSKTYVRGYVKDTAADSRWAAVQIKFADGHKVGYSATRYGAVVNFSIGRRAGAGTWIEVREGRRATTALTNRCWGPWKRKWL
ncbi:hypothetical protein GCM10010411_37600 [Actinomadura fulvescens]|uniref:Secreted protein n=1 Tax=Actinomadura fulvescens TaxID=46160 RepID=A0ABN3PSH8_9ACTN